MSKNELTKLPRFTPATADQMAAAFPDGFTVRDEANALTAYAFRNGPLEELHAGRMSPLLEDRELSRITDAEMKELMQTASTRLAKLLEARDENPREYFQFVQVYGLAYCRRWDR
jgi:hypothetical protein